MEIKWHIVIALMLGVVAIIVIANSPEPMAELFACMKRIGPANAHDDRFFGFVALVVVVICMIGLVRVLANGRSNT